MWSSSGILLLLLPYVALGAVVQDSRNFIQAPANCKPPFALINDRCVFVVQREDSEELRCSEDSGTPCQERAYPSKSVLPRESVLTEDAITDGNNKNQLDERSFVRTIDCKQGYIKRGERCMKIFKRVENRTGEGLTQELDGDINSVDSQIEDIYNTQLEMDPAETEMAHRNIMRIPMKCRPGYRPDMKGRCRKIFNSESSEHNGESASPKRFISACRSGYRLDRNGICREIFIPASSNTQKEQRGRADSGRGIIAVATSGCKSGYRLDSKGRCRKIYTPVSSNSLNDNSGEAEYTKAFIQVPGCAPGSVFINGDCRPVYTGKRDVYGGDYMDTNENPLMQPDLWRRRRSLRNQKLQGHLYSGSEE